MKAVFYIIGLGLAALVGFQGYSLINPGLPEKEISAPLETTSSTKTDKQKRFGSRPLEKTLTQEKTIIHRNLFKVMVDRTLTIGQTKTAFTPLVLEKTKLKLALWGTVSGNGANGGWAVIEDLKKHQQSLYRVGDQVQGGKIKSISRNLVVLTVNGEDEVLEATSPKGSGGKNVSFLPSTKNKFIPTPNVPQFKSNMMTPSAIFKAMKTRTYFKDGQPTGLLVFGMKPGANLQALGLKKGDIIRSVNDTPIQSPEDVDAIAEDMDPTLDIRISLYRKGNPKELIYNGQERTFTIESAEE